MEGNLFRPLNGSLGTTSSTSGSQSGSLNFGEVNAKNSELLDLTMSSLKKGILFYLQNFQYKA